MEGQKDVRMDTTSQFIIEALTRRYAAWKPINGDIEQRIVIDRGRKGLEGGEAPTPATPFRFGESKD